MTENRFRVAATPEKDTAVLTVLSDSLNMADREAFLAACRELLAGKASNLVIDLRALRRIFSVFIGSVMDVNARAKNEGRRLTVLTTEGVATVFRSVVGTDVLEISDGLTDEERARRKISSRRRSPAG